MLDRYSPTFVTGLTMAMGDPCCISRVDGFGCRQGALPESLSPGGQGSCTWRSSLSSRRYVIWYTAVRELGSGHTAIYHIVVPIVAMIVATLFLHEPTTAVKVYGAIAVLAGVVLTRLESVHGEPSEG